MAANASKLWSATDNRDHGRCFTTIPTPDHIKYGIKSISLYLKMKDVFHVIREYGMNLKTNAPPQVDRGIIFI